MFDIMLGVAGGEFYGHQSEHGSFVLGGQLAFIASVEPPSVVSAFIAAKLVGGICAAAAAMAFAPKSGAGSGESASLE